MTTNWLAAAGLTTTLLDVAEVTPPALVVKRMFMVSALLYDRPLNVATPLDSVTVSALPCRLAVPVLPRAAVTVCVLSLVMTLPKASSSVTTGCVPNATPAVAVLDGCVVTTNWLAAAGLTTTLLDVAVNAAGVGGEAGCSCVSALLYDRPLNVATPLDQRHRQRLPCRLAVPWLPARHRHRVRAVAGDDVAEGSSSLPPPAAWQTSLPPSPSLDGCVVTTNWLAVPGLTMMLLDVAEKRRRHSS